MTAEQHPFAILEAELLYLAADANMSIHDATTAAIDAIREAFHASSDPAPADYLIAARNANDCDSLLGLHLNGHPKNLRFNLVADDSNYSDQ